MNDNITPPLDLKVLVVDDEPLARHWLEVLLKQMPMKITSVLVGSAAQATQWLEQNCCHIILLDIHMPRVDGLEFAKKCQQTGQSAAIIFVTADSNHALQAFELHAFDYLTKPVSSARLEQALNKACERMGLLSPQHAPHALKNTFVSVEMSQQIIRIPLYDILYFRSDSKYTAIVTANKNYLSEESLNTLEERLEEYVLRTHRSFLALKHQVKALIQKPGADGWEVELKNHDEKIPVSRRQLASVKAFLR